MPRKKQVEEIRPEFKNEFKNDERQVATASEAGAPFSGHVTKSYLDALPLAQSITPLELSGGLVVTRDELNQVVAKLNEVIKKVN